MNFLNFFSGCIVFVSINSAMQYIPEYANYFKESAYSNKTKYQNLTWRYLNGTLIEIPSAKTFYVSTDPTKEKLLATKENACPN
jgi:hypothetical protein